MGKLFFMENKFKRNTGRIQMAGTKWSDASTRIVFERREVPDVMDPLVYGNGRDPWGMYGRQNWRTMYDAHIKIGDVALTVSLQELLNLHGIIQDTFSANEAVLRQNAER